MWVVLKIRDVYLKCPLQKNNSSSKLLCSVLGLRSNLSPVQAFKLRSRLKGKLLCGLECCNYKQ